MAPRTLCGGVVTSKRSLLALAWTATTLVSIVSLLTAALVAARIHSRYDTRASSYGYAGYDGYYNGGGDDQEDCDEQRDGEGGEGEEGEQRDEGCHHSGSRDDFDEEAYLAYLQASTSSRGVAFGAAYITALGVALCLFGSTSVVGFTSVRGKYVPPCFGTREDDVVEGVSSGVDERESVVVTGADGTGATVAAAYASPTHGRSSGAVAIFPLSERGRRRQLRVGIFMGSLIFFANLLLVCAVVLGEFRVSDYFDERDGEELDPYAIERVATVFAVTCMFLSIVYILFAVLFFVYHEAVASGADEDSAVRKPTTPRRSSRSIQLVRRRRRSYSDGDSTGGKAEPLVYGGAVEGGGRGGTDAVSDRDLDAEGMRVRTRSWGEADPPRFAASSQHGHSASYMSLPSPLSTGGLRKPKGLAHSGFLTTAQSSESGY